MKVWIREKELWPHYELYREADAMWPQHYNEAYEIPEALYREYERARAEFMDVRRRIQSIALGAEGAEAV